MHFTTDRDYRFTYSSRTWTRDLSLQGQISSVGPRPCYHCGRQST